MSTSPVESPRGAEQNQIPLPERTGCMCRNGKTWEVALLVVGTLIAGLGAAVLFGAINVGTMGLPLMIAGAVATALVVGVAIKMIVDCCRQEKVLPFDGLEPSEDVVRRSLDVQREYDSYYAEQRKCC